MYEQCDGIQECHEVYICSSRESIWIQFPEYPNLVWNHEGDTTLVLYRER